MGYEYIPENTFRFKENQPYEGETIFGGCGYVNRNLVHVLKRTKNYIVYRDAWGKTYKTKRHYHIKCEYFKNRLESFYADSIGSHMQFLLDEETKAEGKISVI